MPSHTQLRPLTPSHSQPIPAKPRSRSNEPAASHLAYVFFGRGVALGYQPVTPRRLRAWCLGLLIKLATCSRFPHVSLGDGACVLESSFERVAVLPFRPYLLHFPGLAGFYEVPLKGPLDLTAPASPRKRWPRVALQWLTRGRLADTASCVTLTAMKLRDAGVPVPRCATPGGLARWLRRQGAHYESLE